VLREWVLVKTLKGTQNSGANSINTPSYLLRHLQGSTDYKWQYGTLKISETKGKFEVYNYYPTRIGRVQITFKSLLDSQQL
jgi:hypothetical protein